MREDIIYIKADKNTMVSKGTILVNDIAKIYANDPNVVDTVKKLELFQIQDQNKKNYVFSIMKVIELIQNVYPDMFLCNLGETDFIIEYNPPKKENRVFEYIKVAFVCLIVFFGSAFTIMTFNEDASVESVFALIYEFVLGEKDTESYLLEISYAVGLPVGTIVFFNHFSKYKVNQDPTPLQIQLRLHEEDINTTFIENANREGNSIDVD